MSAIVRAITRCGGVIEKFVGDGVLVTFGARSDVSNSAERAVAAALASVGANEALNRRRSAEWGFRLDVGVGIASGRIVLGRIGPPERAEHGVLGDAINIAARLVSRAGPGEILLSANVHRALGGKVRAELLGSQAVAGRAGADEICRIALLGRNLGT